MGGGAVVLGQPDGFGRVIRLKPSDKVDTCPGKGVYVLVVIAHGKETDTQVILQRTPGHRADQGVFLGPDVLITNYHVLKEVIDQPTLAKQVVLRFDYKRMADGTTLNPGAEFRLADDWLLDRSPYSAVDRLEDPGNQSPELDELDYALVRVAGAPGDLPVGGDKARIGSVSLRDSHAHVRVPEDLVDAIIAGVHGTQHDDHSVTVERARA